MATQNINTEQDAIKGACAAGRATDTRQRLLLGARYAFIDYGKAQEKVRDAGTHCEALMKYAGAFAAIGAIFRTEGAERVLTVAECDGLSFICETLSDGLYDTWSGIDADVRNFLNAIHFDHVTDARNAELAARGVVEQGAENE